MVTQNRKTERWSKWVCRRAVWVRARARTP